MWQSSFPAPFVEETVSEPLIRPNVQTHPVLAQPSIFGWRICLHDYNMVTFHHNLIKKFLLEFIKSTNQRTKLEESHFLISEHITNSTVFSTVWWYCINAIFTRTEQNRDREPRSEPHMRGQTRFSASTRKCNSSTLFFAFYLINSKNTMEIVVESHPILRSFKRIFTIN